MKIYDGTLFHPTNMTYCHNIFKASALWADAFYKSICQSVCLYVCPSVCLSVCSLLRYRLNGFLPLLSEVGCPISFEIRNPWGKVMERSGLRYEHFCLKIVENRRAKKKFFSLHFFHFFLVFFGFRSFLTVFLPPLPKVGCPIFFRDSESLGKSNGKKWSQIQTFLFENCLKSLRKKKFFSSLFSVFFSFRSFLTVFLPPLPKVGCPIFLEIRNPWGKIMERSGLRFEHFCLKIV